MQNDNDDVGGAPSGLFGVQIIPSHQLGKHNNHSDRNYSSDQLQAVIRIIREDHDGHDPSINLGTARGLEIDDMTGAPFHVTFRASDLSANPIIVHVYDLTASDRDDCFQVANRGFEVLDGLAPNTYIPPIVSRLTRSKFQRRLARIIKSTVLCPIAGSAVVPPSPC